MKRRIEIYPNRRIARHKIESLALEKDVTYYNAPNLELTMNGRHYIFLTNLRDMRGWLFDEIYIHPNCSKADRLKYIIEGLSRGAKIVYKS